MRVKTDLLIFSILAVALTAVFFTLPPLCLNANDEGLKYIQMKAFYLNNYRDYDVRYPGKSLGLDFTDLNVPKYFVERGGKIFVSYYLPFTYLTSLFYPLMGDRVIHFWPLITFFLSFIIISRILRMLKPSNLLYYLILFAYLLASPVYLFSITFWEHVPLVFLTTLSLYYLVRFFTVKGSSSNLAFAFIALSLGIFLRMEAFAMMLALFISVLLYLKPRGETGKILPALVSSALVVACYTVFNHHFYGLWLTPGPRTFGFSFKEVLGSGLLVSLSIAAALLLLYKSCKDSKERELVIPVLTALLIFYLAGCNKNGIMGIFFCSFPLIAFLFLDFSSNVNSLAGTRPDAKAAFFAMTVLSLLFVSLSVRGNPHQSMRFMLPLVPVTLVFVCLSKDRLEKHKAVFTLAVCLIIAGFIFNIWYLADNILKYKFYNAARHEFINKNTRPGDVVIFPHPALLMHASSLFSERIYLVCPSDEAMDSVLGKFPALGVTHFYIWSTMAGYKDYFLKMHRDCRVTDTYGFSTSSVRRKNYLYEVACEKKKKEISLVK